MKIKKWLNDNFKIILLISAILSTIFMFILMLGVLINILSKPKSLGHIFKKSLNYMLTNPVSENNLQPWTNISVIIEIKTKITNYDYTLSGTGHFENSVDSYTSTIELEYYYNNIYVLVGWSNPKVNFFLI